MTHPAAPGGQMPALTEADLLRLWIDTIETKCEELRATLAARDATIAARDATIAEALKRCQNATFEGFRLELKQIEAVLRGEET